MAQLAMAAGSGVQAVGALNKANSDAAAADYNAKVADQNANTAIAQADENSRRAMVQSRMQIGAERAGFGASGVGVTGSAADVLASSASAAELDRLTIKNSGEVKAAAYRNEASLDRFRANNSRTAGKIGAAAYMLQGVGNLLGSSGGGAGGGGAEYA